MPTRRTERNKNEDQTELSALIYFIRQRTKLIMKQQEKKNQKNKRAKREERGYGKYRNRSGRATRMLEN